jgi:hypothetical protein
MAKRASRPESSENQELRSAVSGAEHKIEEFAEDLGRLLGSARAKAEGWIGQRQTVAKHLEEIRDTAAELLKKIGGGWAAAGRAPENDGARRPGRPRKSASVPDAPEVVTPEPKRRTMSAAARKAISDAQKARWAKQKRAARKVE